MTQQILREILTHCKSAAYYLPSIETQVSPQVASDIRAHLEQIEFYAKMLNESEAQALSYMNAHSSLPDSE